MLYFARNTRSYITNITFIHTQLYVGFLYVRFFSFKIIKIYERYLRVKVSSRGFSKANRTSCLEWNV